VVVDGERRVEDRHRWRRRTAGDLDRRVDHDPALAVLDDDVERDRSAAASGATAATASAQRTPMVR
jgi:hypothetical protein